MFMITMMMMMIKVNYMTRLDYPNGNDMLLCDFTGNVEKFTFQSATSDMINYDLLQPLQRDIASAQFTCT